MVRRDSRSKLPIATRQAGQAFAHPFTAPSLTYRAMPQLPGIVYAMRGSRVKRAPPREKAREQLRVGVWENEGGSLPLVPVAAPFPGDPAFVGPIRR